jgi:NADH-quinone oxidoreductase subunit G
MEQLAADVEAGTVSAVLSLGWATDLTEAELAPVAFLASQGMGDAAHVNLTPNAGSLTSAASVVVPTTSVAESSGTFVNAMGVAQQFKTAVKAPGGIRTAWETLIEIGERLGWQPDLARLNDVRAAMPSPRLAADASATDTPAADGAAPA